MKSGESKYADLQFERGPIKVNVKINNFNIQQVKEGESNLGMNENISFDDTTNKERVLTEYY